MSRQDRASNLRCVADEMWSSADTDRKWEVLGFILDALSTEQKAEQFGFATKHRSDTPTHPVHPARRAHSAPGSRPDDSRLRGPGPPTCAEARGTALVRLACSQIHTVAWHLRGASALDAPDTIDAVCGP
jgi:hypothetical protein